MERNEIQNENRYKETFYVIEELSQSNLYQIYLVPEDPTSQISTKNTLDVKDNCMLIIIYFFMEQGFWLTFILLFYMYGKMAWFINRTAKTFDDVFYKNLIGEN